MSLKKISKKAIQEEILPEKFTWMDKNGIKHSKILDTNEVPKKLISYLKDKKAFKPFKLLGTHEFDNTLSIYEQIRVGDVLELKNRKYVLVGNVNTNLGVCDDCMNFTHKDIKRIASLF